MTDDAAKEALLDMPPRKEEELDPVTLQNQAIMNSETDPSGAFERLSFLLSQTPCPPEAFGNLLLLYIKYEYFDVAADLLAESGPLFSTTISPHLYDFCQALLLKQNSPEDAYHKLEDIACRQVETLRKLTKRVQEARTNQDDDIVKNAIEEYDACIDRYFPSI